MIRRTSLAALLALALCAAPASAADDCNRGEPQLTESPRIVTGNRDDVPYQVLLPVDYAHSERRYPVLYLLHGASQNEHTWLNQADLVGFTETFRDERAAIVVTPDGGAFGFYSDWRDGTASWETFHLKRLIPHIDATFRTLPDRAHRAVAGFSMGGFGAMHYAGRRPDMFVAAGSFSGAVDIDNDNARLVARGVGSGNASCTGRPSDPWGPFGDPSTNGIHWRNHNPPDLAPNYGGQAIYLAAGNNQPCDARDGADPRSANFATLTEGAARQAAEAFDDALTRAGIAHTTKLYDCGVHTMRYAEKYLFEFWPLMVAAFGTPSPKSYDYRTADPDSGVFGWHITPDPRRAPEFLDVMDAGRTGVTLRGSGRTRVGTERYFKPRRRYRVKVGQARPRRIAATRDGRLFFHVDLGPPHRETDRGEFATKRVTFRSAPRR